MLNNWIRVPHYGSDAKQMQLFLRTWWPTFMTNSEQVPWTTSLKLAARQKLMSLSLGKTKILPPPVQKHHLFREWENVMLSTLHIHKRNKKPFTEKLKYVLEHFILPFPADVTIEQGFIPAEKSGNTIQRNYDKNV